MDDLVAWLTQVWDEQEKAAKAAPGRNWVAFKEDDVAGASVYDEQWVLLYPSHYDHDNPLSSDPNATGPMYIEKARDELCAHIAANDPASVLARIAADRQILALHTGPHECPFWDGNGEFWEDLYCPTTLLLAKAHASRPGFRDEWRVTA